MLRIFSRSVTTSSVMQTSIQITNGHKDFSNQKKKKNAIMYALMEDKFLFTKINSSYEIYY